MKTNRAPWPPQLTNLTAGDVIEGGACVNGVMLWVGRNADLSPSEPVAVLLKRAASDSARVKRAAGIRGNGYGYGDGYGDGYGYGYA